MGCCRGFRDRHKKAFARAKQSWDIVQIILYIADIATDGYASYCYFLLGDVAWGTMTLCFIFPAMIFVSVAAMYEWFIKDKEVSWVMKVVILFAAVIFSPFITLYCMVYAAYGSIRGKDWGTSGMGYIKLSECVLESGPQSGLQTYIIFHYMHDGRDVGTFQIVTLSFSIITLAVGISNCFVFKDSEVKAKVIFFIFGLMTLVTRLFICCIFSLVMKPLFLVPFVTFLALSIIAWLVKKYCSCSDVPLGDKSHACNLERIPDKFVTWFVTAVFNTFTVSSLPIAFASLAYAIGCYFLIPGAVSIVTITLAAFSLLSNILFVAVPAFRVIGETWLTTAPTSLNGDTNEGSWFY